jgi:hypothetical protein
MGNTRSPAACTQRELLSRLVLDGEVISGRIHAPAKAAARNQE